MTTSEQTYVNTAVKRKTVQLSVDQLVSASDEPIQAAGLKLISGLILPDNLAAVVDWGVYAHDLEGKISSIDNTDEFGAQTPLGALLQSPGEAKTRAAYEFARQCLKPPTG